MQTDILKYVEGCDKCQRSNTHRKKASNPLNPNEIPTRPWQIISVDIIGELPESQGFNAIFVIINRFSKQIHAIPINTSLTAEGYTWSSTSFYYHHSKLQPTLLNRNHYHLHQKS